MAKPQDKRPRDRFSLEGKTAFVAGGSGVLGSAIARGLAAAGAKVAIAGITEGKAKRVAAEMAQNEGLKVMGVRADAFDKDAIRAALDRVEDAFGDVNVLVNATGGNVKEATVGPEGSFFGLPAEALEKVVGLNLFAGAIFPCQVVGERMVSRFAKGSIINVSSMNAYRPLTRIVGYSAAKAAVSNFTQWLAVHFAKDLRSQVRVNAIAPGFFLADQNRALLVDGDKLTPRGQTIIDHTPMGRFGDPEDLVGVAVWLAGDASAFVTGTVIPVDGGFSAFSGV
ncbi:MAG TPA: SDR family oxidoreductase [Sumerlaeia bacterium]|nr:SDR family oxidoreductase [Sumerlaeia bacterium]